MHVVVRRLAPADSREAGFVIKVTRSMLIVMLGHQRTWLPQPGYYVSYKIRLQLIGQWEMSERDTRLLEL